MKIIISPAKKMKSDDGLPWQELPLFLEKTQRLLETLRAMPYDRLKALWKCNDSIAEENLRRLKTMDLRRNLTPAILSYEGIQYRYMAPDVFTDREFGYLQKNLRILSGFYGLLRPFDGVTPYRLEMQAKLAVDGAKDLYGFWGADLAVALAEDDPFLARLDRAVAAATKADCVRFAQHGAADTAFFQAAGIPSVEFGPAGAGHHGPDEYVELPSLGIFYSCLDEMVRLMGSCEGESGYGL